LSVTGDSTMIISLTADKETGELGTTRTDLSEIIKAHAHIK